MDKLTQKPLSEFSGVLFFGGGVLAERLFRQIDGIEQKLLCVFDMVEDNERLVSSFHGIEIHNARECSQHIINEDNAIVVCIGHYDVFRIVNTLVEQFKEIHNRLFIVNPYSSLRFFMVDDNLSAEKRVPFNDIKYKTVETLFKDEESIRHYLLLTNSKPYEGIDDTYQIIPYDSVRDMYYYLEDYWSTFSFNKADSGDSATVLDCGAYIGDSIVDIVNSIPQRKIYYYAIEPLEENAKKIENTERFSDICEEITVLKNGVGERNGTLNFHLPQNGDMEGGRFIEKQDGTMRSLEIRRIDDLQIDYKGVLYIKMDIEGSELGALKGAQETITKYHPFLAICVYHRKNDLVDIPLFIKSLGIDYDYYLRGGYHTILWAIPK